MVKIIICKGCKKKKPHEAFGLCIACYHKTPERKRKNKEYLKKPKVKIRRRKYMRDYMGQYYKDEENKKKMIARMRRWQKKNRDYWNRYHREYEKKRRLE